MGRAMNFMRLAGESFIRWGEEAACDLSDLREVAASRGCVSSLLRGMTRI